MMRSGQFLMMRNSALASIKCTSSMANSMRSMSIQNASYSMSSTSKRVAPFSSPNQLMAASVSCYAQSQSAKIAGLMSQQKRSIQTMAVSSPMQENSVASPHSTHSLSLQVADPALLLNHISERYQSTSRIMMEYVDNAFDDAERMFREEGNGKEYPRPINIFIDVDRRKKSIRITDNCSGMNQNSLERLIQNVGSSRKKSVSWLNGQFGFGIHAFRAAAKKLVVHSKIANGPTLSLSLTNHQSSGIAPPTPVSETFPTDTNSGTSMLVEDFSADWFKEIDGNVLKREIELHFERLLSRKNVNVIVREVSSLQTSPDQPVAFADSVFPKTYVLSESHCVPFNYSVVEGTDFQRVIELDAGNEKHQVEIHLKVAKREYTGLRARFFVLGRRIGDVTTLSSFMKESKFKFLLWGHPQLIGFISVSAGLNPVITRDEFKQSELRTALYQALVALEPQIKKALDKEMNEQRVVTLGRLEGVIGKILSKMVSQDKKNNLALTADDKKSILKVQKATIDDDESLPRMDDLIAEEEKKKEPELEEKPKKEKDPESEEKEKEKRERQPAIPPIDIRFANLPPNESGEIRHCQRVDRVITINIDHPDFKARVRTKNGKMVLTDRLNAYLSCIISAQYHDKMSVSTSHIALNPQDDSQKEVFYEALVRDMARLEAALKRNMASLQRELEHAKVPVDVEEYDENE